MTGERGFGARGNLDIDSVRRQIDREFEPSRRSLVKVGVGSSMLTEVLARHMVANAVTVSAATPTPGHTIRDLESETMRDKIVIAIDTAAPGGDMATAVYLNRAGEIVRLDDIKPQVEDVQSLAERLGGEIIISNADPTLVVGNIVQIGSAMLKVVGRTGDSVVLRREDVKMIVAGDVSNGFSAALAPMIVQAAPMISRTISQLERRVERAFNVPPSRSPIQTNREQERRRKQLLKERKRIAADAYEEWEARYGREACACHLYPPCHKCEAMPIHPDEVS